MAHLFLTGIFLVKEGQMEEILVLDKGFDHNDATIYGNCCDQNVAPQD